VSDQTRTTEIAALLAQLAVIMSGQSVTTDEPPVSRPMPARVLLTVEEAAEQLGIGRTLLYKLIARGEIESIRIGRLRRVPTAAIQDYARRLSGERLSGQAA
jgi:excisionase family DNA binding protein